MNLGKRSQLAKPFITDIKRHAHTRHDRQPNDSDQQARQTRQRESFTKRRRKLAAHESGLDQQVLEDNDPVERWYPTSPR